MGMKEVNKGKEGSPLRKVMKLTKGRKEDDHEKDERLQREER